MSTNQSDGVAPPFEVTIPYHLVGLLEQEYETVRSSRTAERLHEDLIESGIRSMT